MAVVGPPSPIRLVSHMSARDPLRTLIGSVLVVTLVATGCSQLADLPKLTKKDLRFDPPESSRMYDSSGNLITTFHGIQNRTVIPLRKIPKHVQRAVVAIEDERFYQ